MAGARILEKGGNVVDAAIATSAVLSVTQNNLCGLGGDAFVLLKIAGRPVVNLNGSGRAFRGLTIEKFLMKGMNSIPLRGKGSVITVPGLVMAWHDLSEKYGTMEIKDLLRDAHHYALEGFPVTHNYSESISLSSQFLGGYSNWRNTFLKDGLAPAPGTVFKQGDLANTLSALMSDGLLSFYDGNLADRIINGLREEGVEIASEDLARHRSTFQEPVKTEYRGFTVYETAPNSQAATVILWLNILSSMDREPELKDVLLAGHAAYSQRDRYIADPESHPLPAFFTSREFASDLARDLPHSSGGRISENRGDTTYFSITDAEGNSISMIQSNYLGFGSGIVPRGTGISFHNRGSYFTLDPRHHNALGPGKRTFHTLCAAMLENEEGYTASLGSMGGDIQPQLHIQLILSLLKNRDDPQSVIDAPRWAFPYTIYEKPGHFLVESDDYWKEIGAIFPDREIRNIGFSSQLGQAQITARLENGVVVGGADPRGDGFSVPMGDR